LAIILVGLFAVLVAMRFVNLVMVFSYGDQPTLSPIP